jgi:hypothetical protein
VVTESKPNSGGNLPNVRREASRHFRNKKKKYLKAKINELETNSKNFLTPWSRGLLEKLTATQLDKKFPVFYGTRRFITAFTRSRHLSLS